MKHSHFLDVIQNEPGDRVPRLIYADWLDESGDPRGELIRLLEELRLNLTQPADDQLICGSLESCFGDSEFEALVELIPPRQQRLLACECVEAVLPVFEKRRPFDKRPRDAIDLVRRYAKDQAKREDLSEARRYACDSAWDAGSGPVGTAAWATAVACVARAAAWSARDIDRDAIIEASREAASAQAWAAAASLVEPWSAYWNSSWSNPWGPIGDEAFDFARRQHLVWCVERLLHFTLS